MLRILPYRKIRKAFERRCMEKGVVLRYVKSHYTSILGAVLTSYPNLVRDHASSAIIGLRGTEEGNAWLEKRCQDLAKEEKARLRMAARLGVHPQTLRRWEREGESPKPARTLGNHRRYKTAVVQEQGLVFA